MNTFIKNYIDTHSTNILKKKKKITTNVYLNIVYIKYSYRKETTP